MRMLFAILLMIPLFYQAQNAEAIKYYNEGIKYFNKKKYKLADSLFTSSVTKEPSKEAYYKRALCREKLANKNGYCTDLANAANLGDSAAKKLFLKKCGTIDKTYQDQPDRFTITTRYMNKDVIYATFIETQINTVVQSPEPNDATIFEVVEQPAEFPGGLNALYTYFQTNVKYPPSAEAASISGKCFVKFVVNTDGSISAIKVLKKVAACPECDEEAVRVIKLMPLWTPGKVNGKTVRSYFTLPVNFRKTG